MLSVRKTFLELTIQKQIQIGVIGVSFCVFFMVFILIVLNSYLLIAMTYADISTIIDMKDSQQITLIAQYTDMLINNKVDLTKISVQYIRNFIQNNKINKEFIENFNKLDYRKTVKDVDSIISYDNCNKTSLNDCIFYKNINQNPEIYNSVGYIRYMEIVAITIPLIKNTFKVRFSPDFLNPIFHTMTLSSNIYKTVIVYEPRQNLVIERFFNTNYSLKGLNIYLNRTANSIATRYYGITLLLNHLKNPLETNTTINRNPAIQFVTPFEKVEFPYKNSFYENGIYSSIVATTSSLYGYNITATIPNLNNTDNIIDIVQGDWSTSTIDYIALNVVKNFKGVKVIATDTILMALITPTACHYFIKFYQNLNQIDTYSKNKFETPLQIWDCWKFLEGKDKFIEYFKNNDYVMQYKRMAKIKLFGNFDENIYDSEYFKVYKFFSPDKSNLLILNPEFLVNVITLVFVIRNMNYFNRNIYPIQIKLFAEMFMIMFYNLVIWFICLFFIIIIVFKITKEITTPIDELVRQVTNYGRGDLISNQTETEKRKTLMDQKKALEAINYPNDKDINDMFLICKSLIKGGLNQNNQDDKNKNSDFFSYNNIFFIKTNNLIVNEEHIRDSFENSETIFTYKFEEKNIQENKNSLSNIETGAEEINIVSTKSKKILLFQNSEEKGLHENSLLIEKYNNKSLQNNLLSIFEHPKNSNFIHNKRKSNNNESNNNFTNFIDKIENYFEDSPRNYLYNILMKNSNDGDDLKLIKI